MPSALGEEAVAELAGESAGDGATDGVVEGPISVDPGIASPVPWQDANTSTTAIHPRDRTRHIVVLPRPRLGVRCTQSAFRARAPARAPRWMTLCAVDRFSEVSARCLSRCRAASAGALRRLARSGAPACPAATIAAGPPGIGIRAPSSWPRVDAEDHAVRGGWVKIVVGLGNPGARYAKTRHNVGWMVVDRLADRAGWGGRGKARDAASAVWGRYEGLDLELVKPLTFMNESGAAVRKVLAREHAPMEEIGRAHV